MVQCMRKTNAYGVLGLLKGQGGRCSRRATYKRGDVYVCTQHAKVEATASAPAKNKIADGFEPINVITGKPVVGATRMEGPLNSSDRRLPLQRVAAERVAYIAGLIAMEAPAKRGNAIGYTLISWRLIQELRDVLEGASFDWADAKAEAARIAKARRDGGQ